MSADVDRHQLGDCSGSRLRERADPGRLPWSVSVSVSVALREMCRAGAARRSVWCGVLRDGGFVSGLLVRVGYRRRGIRAVS